MKTVLALSLALASGSAAALGLGQLELKSKVGEPFLAEITIVSSDPAELEQLRAGLASPETFARVGMQAPDAVVSNLQFTPALNDAGGAVIRVTSSQPIEQSLLTFLIEVDWGQGRLVREYSTLLDAPRTVSAPLQPQVQAPVLASPNAIVRAPVSAPAPVAPPAPAPPGPGPEAMSDDDAPAPVAAVPRPAPASPAADYRPQNEGLVAAGDTLSQIAGRMELGASLDQAMIALLRANPDAFIDGNINRLKAGAVLRVPEAAQLNALDRGQARALVRAQNQQWREASAVPQPVNATGSIADASDAGAEARQPGAAGARLEIVPPGASRATRAGTQSGVTAGGEGDMLRQELQQTRETLAAREAELAEMQSRIAELEKLQGDQQQLLTMKDTQLAAAQQRLASTQQATPDAAPPADSARSSLPWVFTGLALLVLALVGGWMMRRRATAKPTFRAPPPTRSSLADAFAPPVSPPAATGPVGGGARESVTASAAAAAATAPGWVPGNPSKAGAGRGRTGATDAMPGKTGGRSAPAWHAAVGAAPAAASVAVPVANTPDAASPTGGKESPADVPGPERLDLARAYLDLGDHASARQLLAEVMVDGDPDDSSEATRMLRELE